MRYADRGLVVNGYPNLVLFNQLHWLIFGTMISYSYGVFPLVKQLKEDFPQNCIKGQICMKIDFQIDETNLKQRVVGIIAPMVILSFNWRFKKSLSSYTKGKNLRMNTVAQFGGKYQRNLLTAHQTWSYYSKFTAFIIADNALIVVFQIFRNKLDKEIQFIIHNMFWVLILNCFFSVYIPVKHLLLSKEDLPSLWSEVKHVKPSKFYVREYKLIPRRYVYEDQVENGRLNRHFFSYLTSTRSKTKYQCIPIKIAMTNFHQRSRYPITSISSIKLITIEEKNKCAAYEDTI